MANKRIRPAKGWAIYGECGFYTGWYLTRIEAIQDHVYARFGYSERYDKLSQDQVWAWKQLQSKGDRAVKVRISHRAK